MKSTSESVNITKPILQLVSNPSPVPSIPPELRKLVSEYARGHLALHIISVDAISVDANNRQALHIFDNRTKQAAPACFDSDDQWHEWELMAELTGNPRYRYCIDCTPAYQDKMRAAGRCAHPDVVLVNDSEGEKL